MRGETPNPLADRGALAQLRRSDVIGAMSLPATHALMQALEIPQAERGWRLPEVAVVAAVLAQCRLDRPGTGFIAVLSPQRADAGEATLKPLRFERLLRAEEPEELLLALRRAVRLAGGRGFDLSRLAQDLLDRPEWRRRRWLLEYHYPATPPDAPAPEESTS
jgi:CRISPR system Cascade subunit CasB